MDRRYRVVVNQLGIEPDNARHFARLVRRLRHEEAMLTSRVIPFVIINLVGVVAYASVSPPLQYAFPDLLLCLINLAWLWAGIHTRMFIKALHGIMDEFASTDVGEQVRRSVQPREGRLSTVDMLVLVIPSGLAILWVTLSIATLMR